MEQLEVETANGQIAIDDIVVDLDVYPRGEWSKSTVERYAEAMMAGEIFPPIILEQGTRLLLDGMHRYQAHLQRESTHLDAEHHIVPMGIPIKLYAASLSVRHGDRIAGGDLKEVARDTIHANPDFSMKTVAQMLGVTRQTVGRWVGDITARRQKVRKVKVLIFSRAGWSNRRAAKELGIDESTVREDVKDDISPHLTEDLLREASEDLPDEFIEDIVAIREELIFATWDEKELALLHQLRQGKTVVVNMHHDGHPNLVEWCQDTGIFVKIDRRSEWGNPFEMPVDGDRATVIENYEEHYLPYKPSLTSRLGELRGKALGCWCAPEPCHGDVLQQQAYMDAE